MLPNTNKIIFYTISPDKKNYNRPHPNAPGDDEILKM